MSVYAIALASVGVLMLSTPDVAWSQPPQSGTPPKTLAVVVAHADDEGPIAPVLARYARESVKVYLIIASDGVAGTGQQGSRNMLVICTRRVLIGKEANKSDQFSCFIDSWTGRQVFAIRDHYRLRQVDWM